MVIILGAAQIPANKPTGMTAFYFDLWLLVLEENNDSSAMCNSAGQS